MGKVLEQKSDVVDAIREVARQLGHTPSRSEFKSKAGVSEYQILKHFPSWREALRASGIEANPTNIRLEDDVLLQDWGDLVRKHRHIPTRDQYRKEGQFSPGAFEKHFGPWSAIPDKFRSFAKDNPDWTDVVALLPPTTTATDRQSLSRIVSPGERSPMTSASTSRQTYTKLDGVPTYGNPIDFRGLRHEPVNEQGVVFLFGMVARELGYMVEAVQTGYPDCEAKRQIGPGKWQRVRIEFEYESRNFRDHGHPVDGCDVIVCWRHNWPECPDSLEVLELRNVIKSLAATDDV
jgi:hypothetical protein